jgi:hypothetical protein
MPCISGQREYFLEKKVIGWNSQMDKGIGSGDFLFCSEMKTVTTELG